MRNLVLAWEKSAFSELSSLLTSDPAAAQALIDLAIRAAADPEAAGITPVEDTDLYSVQDEAVYLVLAVDLRMERMAVVAIGLAG